MRRNVGISLSLLGRVCAVLGLFCAVKVAPAQDWRFTDVTQEAGFNFSPADEMPWSSVASEDYDNDGDIDLMITRAGAGPNLLYRNNGDGTFTEVAAQAGVAMFSLGLEVMSSLFFDFDGDRLLDLFVGVRPFEQQRLYRNKGDGTFEEVTGGAGITLEPRIFSSAAGDYDLDGDLDLYLAMNRNAGGLNHLWRNNGDGSFTDRGEAAKLLAFTEEDREFSPTFADVNNDGYPDLLLVADFNTSQVFINQGDGTFENTTDRNVITDEGGMGSAVGDYDNDGDLDWFVSSIWDPEQDPDKPWGVSSGNRLYRNKGDGTFEDATDEAGVRIGYWGWGSIFADFDNDGHLDIFHTNGFDDPIDGPFFRRDPSRFFHANGDGTFTEKSEILGLDDTGIGNGVTAFDYDADGDLDLFISNASGGSKLFRNDGGNANNTVNVRLIGAAPNTYAIGGRVWFTALDGPTQMRELQAGNHFLSQSPAISTFGLGTAETGVVEVRFPNGVRYKLYDAKPGELIRVPELPLSYNAQGISTSAYLLTIRNALTHYQEQGLLTKAETNRLLFNALKAFLLNK